MSITLTKPKFFKDHFTKRIKQGWHLTRTGRVSRLRPWGSCWLHSSLVFSDFYLASLQVALMWPLVPYLSWLFSTSTQEIESLKVTFVGNWPWCNLSRFPRFFNVIVTWWSLDWAGGSDTQKHPLAVRETQTSCRRLEMLQNWLKCQLPVDFTQNTSLRQDDESHHVRPADLLAGCLFL